MKVALVGNPNCGKTSIFNLLTGSHQKVGNWPGVTVEKRMGQFTKDQDITFVDLPGLYSLAASSVEERITRDFLLEEKPDCIVNVVDGTNLERNLYLTVQLLELNLPVILLVNMYDLMKQQNITIDIERLKYKLDIDVIYFSASKKIGLNKLQTSLYEIIKKPIYLPRVSYNAKLESMVNEVTTSLPDYDQTRRFEIIQMLETGSFDHLDQNDQKQLKDIRQVGQHIFKKDLMTVIINERYKLIDTILKFTLYAKDPKQKLGRKIDKIITNKWLAFPIFILVMWLVYYLSIQTIGTMCSDWVNDVLLGEYLPNLLTSIMNNFAIVDWLQDLVINGIFAGVGAVLGFLPQIAVLFLCLNILEDCGYMSRIAFVMDRVFRYFGLSGKSFIPLLISTGCGVPGIMATRTIENPDERKITIMLSTFLPCSAKTAVIALIVGAFFNHQTWVAPLVYLISILTIIISGLLLKNSPFFHRDKEVFVMELPDYHFPHWNTVFRQTWIRCVSFVKRATTIIFVSSVVLWILSNCSWTFKLVKSNQSMLADIGRLFAFMFVPLGFGNWQETVAVLSSFSAKENIINTLGILYHKTVTSTDGVEIWQSLRNQHTVYSAFSFLVFNILCTPCFAAIGAMKRELGTNKSAVLVVCFQCGMAYLISLIIYQMSLIFLAHQPITIWTIIALIVLICLSFGMIYKFKKKGSLNNG